MTVRKPPTEKPEGARVLPIRPWPDLCATFRNLSSARDWFCEGAIEATPIVLYVAPEKSGKSWSLLDLTVATVTRGKWLGTFQCCKPGPVLYIDAEYGQPEFVRRVARICRARGVDVEGVLSGIKYYHNPQLTLCGDLLLRRSLSDRELEQRRPFADLIQRMRTELPALVIVDPLRNLLPGGSENDAEVILSAFTALDAIRSHGLPVVAAHHVNKSGSYSGSRALLGRADLILEGSDESKPWFASKGRTLRHRDRLARKFTIEISHESDDDDLIASTKVAARFEGDKRGESDGLSSSARKVLRELHNRGQPTTATQLRSACRLSGAVVGRALDELESAGKVESVNARWQVNELGIFGFGSEDK